MRPLTIARTWQFGSVRAACDVEREAHKILAAKRQRGEWFLVNLPEAIAAVEIAMFAPGRWEALLSALGGPLPPPVEAGGYKHKAGVIVGDHFAERERQRLWLLSCGAFGSEDQAQLFCAMIRRQGGKVIFQSGPEAYPDDNATYEQARRVYLPC